MVVILPALVERGIIEARKRRKPNFHSNLHNGKLNLNNPKTRLIFIITLVASILFILFLVGLIVYGKKEWNRKKDGKKPRWGRVILKALALATFLWIPIWIYKKIRSRKRGKGSYNKLDEAGGMTQAQWYGNTPSSSAYVGAGSALHGENKSYYDPNVNFSSQPYDSTTASSAPMMYGHSAVPTGYVAPKYDPPPSMPDDNDRRSPAPPYQAPPYHQPPSPEMHAATPAPVQAESGAWNPQK